MKLAISLSAAVFAASIIGCGGAPEGPKTAPVTGQVTLDGEPVAEGEIIFRPSEGGDGRSDAGAIRNGNYTMESTLGAKRVEIRAMRPVAGAVEETLETGETGIAVEQYIPEKFNDKSELTADVQDSADNKIDFALTTE